MLIAVAVANRHITGVAVVGIGLLVNLVGVAVNGGMPVSAGALEAAGLAGTGRAGRDPTRAHLQTSEDPLPVLGDTLPMRLTTRSSPSATSSWWAWALPMPRGS